MTSTIYKSAVKFIRDETGGLEEMSKLGGFVEDVAVPAVEVLANGLQTAYDHTLKPTIDVARNYTPYLKKVANISGQGLLEAALLLTSPMKISKYATPLENLKRGFIGATAATFMTW